MNSVFKVTDVFTPSSPANYTFIERENSLNKDLVNSLATRGKQIIIYGETGTGKTTLLVNKLNQLYENYIITRCTSNYSFDQLILDAFDQLDKFYTSNISREKGWKINPEIIADFLNIKTEINSKKEINQERLIPVQLTLNRLAKYIGEIKACWVIEDFHKIPNIEKINLSQAMKVFMDTSFEYPEVKIIATGAVDSPRKILDSDKELDNNRLSQILVPLMTYDELVQIIFKGEDLLNIQIKEDIIRAIGSFANGLPSFVHQLCLNMCLENNLYTTQPSTVRFEIHDFEEALKQYMNTHKDTLRFQLHMAIGKTNKGSINQRSLILRTLTKFEFGEYSSNEILKQIKISNSKLNYSGNNISYYLKDLTTKKRSKILRHNKELNKFSFNSPLMKAFVDYELFDRHFKIYDNLFDDIELLIRYQSNTLPNKLGIKAQLGPEKRQ